MLKSALSAAFILVSLQPMSFAQDVLPQDANEARLNAQLGDVDVSSLRHGLTGPVSPSSEQALVTGARIPIIVMMRPAKDRDVRGFTEPRAGESPELTAIRALRERVLLDAFGGNGVQRADAADATIAQRGGSGESETASRPVLTRAYLATPHGSPVDLSAVPEDT